MKEKYQPKEFDLFEIIVSAELDQVKARIERYRVRRTYHNFIQLMLTEELERKGYCHRTLEMSGRLPVERLMKIDRIGRENSGYVYRSIYCLEDQKGEATRMVLEAIENRIEQSARDSADLLAQWRKSKSDESIVFNERLNLKGLARNNNP